MSDSALLFNFFNLVPFLDVEANRSFIKGNTMEELFASARSQVSVLAIDADWSYGKPELRSIAGRVLLLDNTLGRWQADERKKIIAEVGGISDTVAGRLSDTDLRELAERQQLISEILNGHKGFVVLDSQGKKTSYDEYGHNVQFSPAGGRAQAKDLGFDGMTINQLRELRDVVVGQRAMHEMSVDDLKKIVNESRVQKFSASSVSVRESGVGFVDNAGNEVFKVPVPAVAVTDGFILRHPDTEVPFDRTSLVRFLRENPRNARRLLINKFTGKSIVGAAAALESILRSSN